jgi:RNA polymerase sigma-70 factor (ECF subfamily)
VSEVAVTDSSVEVMGTVRSVDRAAIERAARGDHAAFDTLVAARSGRLYRTALAILRSESDAQDATQDAFVAAWQHLPGLRNPEQFDAWLGRILVNMCRDGLRRRNRRQVREIDVESDEGSRAVAVRDADRAPFASAVGEADAIRRAFSHLGPDHRALVTLHYVEGRPLGEIAVLLSVPEGTIKWRLYRARAALEAALREEDR